MTVKLKIYFMVGLILALNLASVLYATQQMRGIGSELQSVTKQDLPLTEIVTKLTVHQLEQAINFERALRFSERRDTEPAAAAHFKQAIARFDELGGQIAEESDQGKQLAQRARDSAIGEEARQEFAQVLDALKKIGIEHDSYADHVHQAFALAKAGKMHEAFGAAEGIGKEEEKLDHELEALLFELEKFTHHAADVALKHEEAGVRGILIVLLIALATGAGMAFFIIRNVTAGLNRAVDIATVIASGDLSREVGAHGTDEIGKLLGAMKIMREKLHGLLTQINDSSAQLASAAEELSAASEQTNQALHEQQGEVTQVATAMNEMNATVQEVANNASRTAASANEANQQAHDGSAVVSETTASIEQLSQDIENSAAIIRELGSQSEGIGGVLDVIKGIAEQTNLLALNAAIEAARAGEQGRGFAVVADEVRTLAQRTQESTAEIENMIIGLQEGARRAVGAMDGSQKSVRETVRNAGRAGESLASITASVIAINDMNTQIASAAEEQTAVAEEINRNINNISSGAEQTASASNEITASSESLAELAANLRVQVELFKV